MRQLKYILSRLKPVILGIVAIAALTFVAPKTVAQERFKAGELLFHKNCMGCHIGGNNLILPEKNLRKQALETNGMDNVEAIMYQVTNGKNGMPAFGGRLREEQIERVANYVLQEFGQRFERR
jgi:cytochrome c6